MLMLLVALHHYRHSHTERYKGRRACVLFPTSNHDLGPTLLWCWCWPPCCTADHCSLSLSLPASFICFIVRRGFVGLHLFRFACCGLKKTHRKKPEGRLWRKRKPFVCVCVAGKQADAGNWWELREANGLLLVAASEQPPQNNTQHGGDNRAAAPGALASVDAPPAADAPVA